MLDSSHMQSALWTSHSILISRRSGLANLGSIPPSSFWYSLPESPFVSPWPAPLANYLRLVEGLQPSPRPRNSTIWETCTLFFSPRYFQHGGYTDIRWTWRSYRQFTKTRPAAMLFGSFPGPGNEDDSLAHSRGVILNIPKDFTIRQLKTIGYILYPLYHIMSLHKDHFSWVYYNVFLCHYYTDDTTLYYKTYKTLMNQLSPRSSSVA